MVQVVLTPTMLFLSILGGFRAPHTLIFLRRQMLSFSAVGGCCGYSKVLESRGLLILLKLTLVSDEGVYIIVARPKAICYGRTFTVNGRAFTFRHLVDCVTFGADFGRLQPAKQQCGCHGLKRRHSDLFPPTRNVNREASCYTTEQYGHRQGNRRGWCCKRRQNVHSTLLCKRMHKGLYNWELVRTQFKTLKLNCRARYSF